MLSFEQKLAIADSFPELQRKDVSLGRVNYHYEESAYDKKTVVYHLHPNGNGFVYAGQLDGYETDDKGFVNIRDFGAEELRAVIGQSILSLSGQPEGAGVSPGRARSGKERWANAKNQELTLELDDEDGMWYVFSGLNLDAAFDTYEEAAAYLREEGFARS
ncbi:hypothetical protein GE107_15900 [Cohnella sp. CFH 77786]|uniref:hypothetical protein n=1 Tax=Cohnella sp. CFH 77786 TaxID=2662265 RepID=UPI001C608833|nr:hypothetical protein [Cohnella sp. CFH 77786]MBW5447542.1 hypothetical protein [Cohnella sp. CFH 77786]